MDNGANNIINNISVYGAPAPICFDTEDYNLINYLDLIRKKEDKTICLPAGVVEFQYRPLLYLMDYTHLSEESKERNEQILNAKKLLANRGDISYLGILNPGQLEVYPIDLKKELGHKITLQKNDSAAPLFFQSLVAGKVKLTKEEPDYIHKRIYHLLDQSSAELLELKMKPDEILSLIGRALFFRFLKDRKIILHKDINDICPGVSDFKDCFSDPEKAASTSEWLDKTFNGDLLPLPDKGNVEYYKEAGRKTNNKLFIHLKGIISGSEPKLGGYQLRLWNDLDFSHIPVGLLSQVYESFSHKWNPHSKSTSIYYTPRSIADFMTNEAFHTLKEPEKAKILDPALGAGIFLVFSFRRLVAERWKADGVRPNGYNIKKILYNQITGFDINESALKLAALSLYLTAIELDPNPRPPEKMRFPKPLRDRILFYFRKKDDHSDETIIGSLGDTSQKFDGKYDLVIGNPPWTPNRNEYLTKLYTGIVRDIARRRGLNQTAKSYKNPDGNPDIPFIWKAMEWAKKDGVIAFALPSRILFKQSESGKEARKALFDAAKINGIMNCSNLSDTKVWSEMSQPFFLFFAKNSIPDQDSQFRFISPYYENGINSEGRIRIDYSSAEPVEIGIVEKEPWILKALSVGTALDIGVIRKLIKRIDNDGVSIKDYWKKNNLKHRRGYGIYPKQDQRIKETLIMYGYPDLTSDSKQNFYLKSNELRKFEKSMIANPLSIDFCKSPLLIIRKSIGADRKKGRHLLTLDDIVYSETFYGYSANGHPRSEELIRYIYLIAYSNIITFWFLLTSAEFSAERRVIQKRDFDTFPFIPPEKLSKIDRNKIFHLSEKLAHDSIKPFDEIDKFVCGIYGLDDADVEVINDTVEVGLPFENSRKRAEKPPTKEEKKEFAEYLKEYLAPFFHTMGKDILITVYNIDFSTNKHGWQFLILSTSKKESVDNNEWLKDVIDIANKEGASRIIIKKADLFILGILNQYRYWTKSRARLCGRYILNYMDDFLH